MITWNIDPTNYSSTQLEKLLDVVENMDSSIATQISDYLNNVNTNRFDHRKFTPPFRLGKKQKRAVLDANGKEVIIMPHNSEIQAQMYCDYLNGL
jgi:hypothetical protein